MSEGPAADELLRALAALQLSQSRWLAGMGEAVAGDPAFAAVFRRWQEELTMVKLQLHRVEGRLLNFLIVAQDSDRRSPRGRAVDGRAAAAQWRVRLESWFALIHLPTAYRRLDSALDLDQEAMTGDIITDLSVLAETIEVTAPALAELAATRDLAALEETAFFRVVAPWKRTGLPAMNEVLRWLNETLDEQEDW